VSDREKQAYKITGEEVFIPDFSVPHLSILSPHHPSCKWLLGVSPPSPPNASVSPSSHPVMLLFL